MPSLRLPLATYSLLLLALVLNPYTHAEEPHSMSSPLPELVEALRPGPLLGGEIDVNKLQAQLAWVQEAANHPTFKELSKLATDPSFMGQVEELRKKQDLPKLLGFEVLWVFAIFLLRMKLSERPAHWTRRVLTRLWTAALLMTGTLAIPYFVYGEAYFRVTWRIFSIFRNTLIG